MEKVICGDSAEILKGIVILLSDGLMRRNRPKVLLARVVE